MKKWLLMVCALVLASGIPPAMAAVTGWYVGIGAGQARSGYSDSDAISNLDYVTVNVDNKDTAYKLFGGYRFDRSLGVEFGYEDLGKTDISGSDFSGPLADKLTAKAVSLQAVGIWPLASSFSLFGKAGVAVAKGEYTCLEGCPSGGLTTHKTETVPAFGVGAQYDFANRVGVRAEIEHLSSVAYGNPWGEMVRASYNVFSADVVFRF
jgi:OOP family OmpA-OmpF porin